MLREGSLRDQPTGVEWRGAAPEHVTWCSTQSIVKHEDMSTTHGYGYSLSPFVGDGQTLLDNIE